MRTGRVFRHTAGTPRSPRCSSPGPSASEAEAHPGITPGGLLTGLHELNMAVSYLCQREGGAHGCAGQLIATAALLNPITWPEPFGLVMAQALATATPVLAF